MNHKCLPPVVAALIAVALTVAYCATPSSSQYLRIAVTPKVTVYAQFTDNQLRLATTVAGLDKAKAIRATQSRFSFYEFSQVPLPVSASVLGKGWSGISATFDVLGARGPDNQSRPHRVFTNIGLSRKDAAGAQWGYWRSVGDSQTGSSAAGAPAVAVPQMAALTLKVTARAKGRQLGIGAVVMAGKRELSDITKNGKSAETLRVTVRNERGTVVATTAGPLSKFGFG